MRHLQICFALTIGNHMFCQAALRSILCLDRLATAEACIRLEPNNVSVDIGSGLQKFYYYHYYQYAFCCNPNRNGCCSTIG